MAGPKQAKAAAFMRKAIQYFEHGDLGKAQKNVAKYLSIDPANADANHLSGVIALQTGKPDQAVRFVQRALQANPRIAMAHNNLGEAYRALEQFADAEASYRAASKIEPQTSGYWNNLGIVLLAQGRADEAVEAAKQALTLDPRSPMAYTNLGNALQEAGDIAGAVEAHERALKLQPSFIEARVNLGIACKVRGDLERAKACCETVLQADRSNIQAMTTLAKILGDYGDIPGAEALWNRVIELEPLDKDHYVALADFYRYADQPEQAVAVLESYIDKVPSATDGWSTIASTWRAAGNKKKALEAAHKANDLHPDDSRGHIVIAQMMPHTERDYNIEALEAFRARHTELPIEQQGPLHFALAKALEDLEEYDEALEVLVDGNRIRRDEENYSIETSAADLALIRSNYSKAFFDKFPDTGCADKTPIFIVGMPRSGTSLVEQITASHSHVFGAGELKTLAVAGYQMYADAGFPSGDLADFITPEMLTKVGEDYVSSVRGKYGDDPRITDKMPHNFQYVGLIKACLPNAKIIHCQRNPMDNCLSIFKHGFAESHGYAYDMTELGLYYRQYLEVMEHWRETLPGFVYDSSYEELVADVETGARNLIDFLELDWEPACLEFYKTERTVNTISASQVREPIYNKSVALWKRYGDGLQPLLDALGDAVPS